MYNSWPSLQNELLANFNTALQAEVFFVQSDLPEAGTTHKHLEHDCCMHPQLSLDYSPHYSARSRSPLGCHVEDTVTDSDLIHVVRSV